MPEEAGAGDLQSAMRRRRKVLRLGVLVLGFVTAAWGVWCWLVVTEYVTDYGGMEKSVGLVQVIASLGGFAGLAAATVKARRSLAQKPYGGD